MIALHSRKRRYNDYPLIGLRGQTHDAKKILKRILQRLVPRLMAERDLRVQCFNALGYAANIRKPKTFNEKIQHRKLFDDDYRFVLCADKFLVKDYVKSMLGNAILIPTLFAGPHLPPLAHRNWKLPFVIKANHGSGMNILCAP